MRDGTQALHGFYAKAHGEKQRMVIPRLYAPPGEKVCLTFFPLKNESANPDWEDWHSYPSALRIYMEDCHRLLQPYFNRIFPTPDPINGQPQARLDVCFDNWIGRAAWLEWLRLIRADLPLKPVQEQAFYQEVLSWVEGALEHACVIVVEGNQ